MKKILCAITAFVVAVSDITFLGWQSVSAEKRDAMEAGEAYLQVIKQNSMYVNYTDTMSNYSGELEYVNYPQLEMCSREDRMRLSYALCDFAGDGTPEILLATVSEDGEYREMCDIWGYEDGELEKIEINSKPSDRYYVTEDNMIMYQWSFGAGYRIAYYSLEANSATPKKELEYSVVEGSCVQWKNGVEIEVDYDYDDMVSEEKELEWYSVHDPSALYELMGKISGKSIPGSDITASTKDSELIQMQNCIKLLHGIHMSIPYDACNISVMSEYDMANLMEYIGRYYGDFVGESVYAGEPPEDWVGLWKKCMRISDMYDAAYKYFGTDIEGVFEQLSRTSPPKDSRIGWNYQGSIETIDGAECVDVGKQIDAGAAAVPYIEKIYSLSNDCSYVLYKYYEDFSEDGTKPCKKPLRGLDSDSGERIRYGYAIIKNRIENGKKHHYIVQCGNGINSFLTVSEVNQYKAKARKCSNIHIDYLKITDYTEPKQYIGYLAEVIKNVVPNDSAKQEIAEYIEYVIKCCCFAEKRAEGGKLTVDRECVETALVKSDEIRELFNSLLADCNITLNKSIRTIVCIGGTNSDAEKGIIVAFDKSLLDINDKFDGIRVGLGGQRQAVYATAAQIEGMLGEGTNSVYIKKSDNEYGINFLTDDEKPVERIDDAITFVFESDNSLDTVFFKTNDGNDINWGGQIDALNGTVEINAGSSGNYFIEQNEPDITDISSLSDEEYEATEFMVSRGFFDLTDGEFRPYMSLSRYDFTRAIVSLFYELNLDAKCSFPDVESDNGYYPYVASAEERDTVVGYEDNTFRGDNHTTREELISIAARTLANRKGYSYPENTEEYINFADSELIQGWENQYGEIAFAVREGLIDDGGILAPQMNITRADAALILYRLFNLLYDTAPIKTQTAAGNVSVSFPVVLVALGGVGLVGLGTVFYVLRKRIG